MIRSKTNFRAIREMLGMSQQLMADLLDVDVRSVKRWESPKAVGYKAPDDAWDLLNEWRQRQNWVIEATLDNLGEVEEEMGGKPRTVRLSYWFSAEEYESFHPGEGPYWQMANANSRAVAVNLSPDIYDVDFISVYSKME